MMSLPKPAPGGTVERFTALENKTGRWIYQGRVERVYWRAVPADGRASRIFALRRRALEYLAAPQADGPAA